MRLIADNLEAAVTDPSNAEARYQMMFAAMLAGISFGNAGVRTISIVVHPYRTDRSYGPAAIAH
jgi:alcohol dehydrogenase class IV